MVIVAVFGSSADCACQRFVCVQWTMVHLRMRPEKRLFYRRSKSGYVRNPNLISIKKFYKNKSALSWTTWPFNSHLVPSYDVKQNNLPFLWRRETAGCASEIFFRSMIRTNEPCLPISLLIRMNLINRRLPSVHFGGKLPSRFNNITNLITNVRNQSSTHW